MRHEKTVSVSKIKHLWEPWEEDETPRKLLISMVANFLFWQNQANFCFDYKVRTMIIVQVTTKEK